MLSGWDLSRLLFLEDEVCSILGIPHHDIEAVKVKLDFHSTASLEGRSGDALGVYTGFDVLKIFLNRWLLQTFPDREHSSASTEDISACISEFIEDFEQLSLRSWEDLCVAVIESLSDMHGCKENACTVAVDCICSDLIVEVISLLSKFTAFAKIREIEARIKRVRLEEQKATLRGRS